MIIDIIFSTYILAEVDCRDPESITNGKIEPYGTKYLDKASIRCDLGYIVKGSPSIFCASSGKWSEIPECIGKDIHNFHTLESIINSFS